MVELIKYDGPWDPLQYVDIQHSGRDNATLRNVKLHTGSGNTMVCWEGEQSGRVEVFQETLRLTCNLRVDQ